jgi:hypothetical protein
MHSTQTWFVTKQAGVASVSVQSLFRPHSTQVCVSVKQNGVGPVWGPQSPFASHWTQTLLLQMGVGALQSESWLHPATHVFVLSSQTGVGSLQSESPAHPTQLPLSQTGVGVLQSESWKHWSLHVWLFVSQ